MKFLIFLCVWCSGLVSTSVAVIVHKQSNNVSYVHTEQANSIQDVEHRNLADSPGLMGKDKKMNKVKLERMDRIVALAEKETFPGTIYKADWSVEHRFNENAILSAAMHPKATSEDANAFLGTLRKSGFTGDVVIAILPNSPVSFVNKVKEYNAITYFVPINCGEKENSISCSFEGHEFKASVNMIRYWVYQYWAALYSKDSILLLSDFFDVFFQSDPIAYRKNDWFPQNQLVVYQEAFPNMVIAREVFNAGWIRECYGEKALKQIESNTVSCSGSTMGTRNGILVYSFLILKQLRRVGYGTANATNRACISVGMDQGFHNWILYSNLLKNYLNVKIYQQGEGSVNTVGGFFGQRKILQFSLETWKVMRGKAPNKAIYNWNGDKSPVTHQINRFLDSELKGGYGEHFAVFQGLQN